MNLWLMRGPLSNQGWCLANAYSNAIINSKACGSIKMMEQSYRILLFKNNCLTNELINSLTLHMEVFIYNVYRDEQVDPLVVDFSLNIVNHYCNWLIKLQCTALFLLQRKRISLACMMWHVTPSLARLVEWCQTEESTLVILPECGIL